MQMKKTPESKAQGRYMESGGECTYSLWWSPSGLHEVRYMHTEQSPEWLKAVVNAAKLGGYAEWAKAPPPEWSVWFYLDADYRLVSFESKGTVSTSDNNI